MASALQNRLVGTVILVAVAVIFLPDMLDGKKTSNQDVFVNVPPAPNQKPIVNPEPFPAERVASATQRPIEIVNEPALDDEPEPQVAEPDETVTAEVSSAGNDDLARQTVVEAPDEASTGNSWVIQLGSFRHQKNVKQLLDKLEDAGYRAFSKPIVTSSGPLTKVFVGPNLDKSTLETAIPHLQELTGLKGKVTTFSVNS
ncbi:MULTISPECIES: SPOR domain-containing protein [Marisediminitalea]|uniref:SPOR domain-containing protein n=1 Tax=Marisediminitalea TaxID=2662254 RepID=UPI0020CB8117|nr:SPOR domain-containing protein [Marisediminitalea aggregata]MCP3865600.1 SPOR domain-containing protein [Aestuariibacter sp.]MCP4234225.1 SPOR domain-containing protein [Aestuariibacter sp.]MCP4525257.1 SPOR domain-containing protein [Aestuariibacter sp.]MCP4947268.1 SPOR domain-containing protein [Aestuariibacter sp.]MCP5011003.1 SPOR domain-containing protein [Aestuariibacter sp.]